MPNKTQLQTNNQLLRTLLDNVNNIKNDIESIGGASLDDLFGGDPIAPFTYTVESVTGASYGFTLNNNGYYESQNKEKNSSYAICRIQLQVNTVCNVTLDCINYAESNWDYGLISNLDKTLTLSKTADTSNVYKNFKTLHSENIVKVTFTNVPVGSHTIDVKFIKDSSAHKYNDSIQFKIEDIVVEAVVPETTIEKILAAEPNLKAENIREGVDIYGVVGTLEIADEPKFIQLINRNFTTINNSIVSSIGSGAFAGCYSLASVNFPACTYIGISAFYSCYSLLSVNFPACSYIGTEAFRSCDKLEFVNFPVCSYIECSAFQNCYYSLKSVDFPACTYIRGIHAFADCTRLKSVNFPVCSYIGERTFWHCLALTFVNFPVCSYIGSYTFTSCHGLTSLSFPACSYIGDSTFWHCSNLTTITLGLSAVCSLAGSGAFLNTGITSTTGSIFVPASLVDSYKVATNWTYFSNRIFSIV